MKKHINLYHVQYHPKFIWITLSHSLMLCVLALVLIFIILGVMSQQTKDREATLTSSQLKLTQQQATLKELTSMLNLHTEDKVLLHQRDSLKMDLDQRNVLVKELKRLGALQDKTFSSLFNSLAQIDSPLLWISDVHVIDQNIQINGGLSAPSALPVWVRSLSNTPYFQQRSFKTTSVLQDDSGMSFLLSTLKTDQNLREVSDASN